MAKKYAIFAEKPVLKKRVIVLKTVAAVAVASVSFFTIKEVAKEVYESVTTENTLIDLDYGTHAIVIKNKDPRTTEQLYLDIEAKILEIDNLEKAFKDNSNLTKQEKEAIIQELVQVISKEAGITTDEFKLSSTTNYAGYYNGQYTSLYTTTSGNIYLNDDAFMPLDDDSLSYSVEFSRVIKTAIHEMIHAIEYENVMRGNNVSPFDKKVFKARYANDYETSFVEINAQLVSNAIYDKLCQTYMASYNKYETSIKYKVLPQMVREIYLNLYDVDTSTKAATVISQLPTEIFKKINKDPNGYMQLTVKELIILGFEKKLQVANINYDNIKLKETYYYKSFINQVPKEMLQLRCVDMINRNYDKLSNVEYNVLSFENTKTTYEGTAIARDLANFLNNLRYYSEEFTETENVALIGVVENNILRLSEYDMHRYALNDYEEVILAVEQNQSIDNYDQSAEPQL